MDDISKSSCQDTTQEGMETHINNNLLVPQGVENINSTASLSENIYQYDLPPVFENFSSQLTATTANSQINQNQNENLQHPDNETAQLLLENLGSPNELIAQDTYRLLEDNRDREELRLLLQSWNQEELVDHLLRENVVIKILKIIKQHHIEKLLKSFDLGTQILFEDNLEKWRNSLNLPLETPNMNFSNLSGPSSPALSTESDVPSTSRSRFSPYRRSSTPSVDETTMITLSTILNETPKGIMLVEYYKKYGKFDDEQRSLLINTCANFFEENSIKMSMADSYRLEKEILERFPTEKLISLFEIFSLKKISMDIYLYKMCFYSNIIEQINAENYILNLPI
ncbi:uncharacterized protein LOC112456838 [Temnothorax curvispinosus]|uniref:Uncharacterized protein LOC112456838 n=1 Tax=Temnothorax curvispinosus TaxID=300111 RepID=A0A6J1PZP1_9HYME|nr:uncharacterized protein LOC112456838 [Temnothorax curvispinosus]